MNELLLARNPDPDSTLPYLLRVPLGEGLIFRAKDTWPRTTAIYCHPVEASEWPTHPDIIEAIPLRSVARRGAAIDIVAARGRENRSQLVYTKARGRGMVFWQSPRTRKQARPDVTLPMSTHRPGLRAGRLGDPRRRPRAAPLALLPPTGQDHHRRARLRRLRHRV